MHLIRSALILVAVVIVVGAGITLGVVGRSVSQPIAFNHRLHVEENGSECVDCHRHALDGERATIPNIEVCAECHEEAQTDSAEEARVVEHIQEGVPIPWRKVYWMPDHVYFSHRRHTAVAGIECDTCHGNVGERTTPVTRPLVSLSMSACMGCHDRQQASNDCLVCHR